MDIFPFTVASKIIKYLGLTMTAIAGEVVGKGNHHYLLWKF